MCTKTTCGLIGVLLGERLRRKLFQKLRERQRKYLKYAKWLDLQAHGFLKPLVSPAASGQNQCG